MSDGRSDHWHALGALPYTFLIVLLYLVYGIYFLMHT